MKLSELARELAISDHDGWLLAAQLVRTGGWEAVFARGTELTPVAEAAIRDHVAGLYRALAVRRGDYSQPFLRKMR